MSLAKLAGACALLALALSACGTSSKPLAGSSGVVDKRAGRGVVDDPRTKHLNCLRQHHIQAVKVGQTKLQIGTAPGGPSVVFAPTPGAAQREQIVGQVVNSEVIGSALLAPNEASDQELKVIEDCLSQGVNG
jgi:hypothetical protein